MSPDCVQVLHAMQGLGFYTLTMRNLEQYMQLTSPEVTQTDFVQKARHCTGAGSCMSVPIALGCMAGAGLHSKSACTTWGAETSIRVRLQP